MVSPFISTTTNRFGPSNPDANMVKLTIEDHEARLVLLEAGGSGSSPTFTNVTVTGTLDVAGATTFASTVAVTGALTVTGQILTGTGTAAAPAIAPSAASSLGIYFPAGTLLTLASGATPRFSFQPSTFYMLDNVSISWATIGAYGGTTVATIDILAANSYHVGKLASATPSAVLLTLGEASRAGTDTNVGAGDATIQPALGTGTGTTPSMLFKGIVLAASGSGAQTYQTMLTIKGVTLGFYNHAPIAQQTGVAVDAAGIHAALVALGLITA